MMADTFVSILAGILVGFAGVIYGLVSRMNAMKTKGNLDVLESKLEDNDKDHDCMMSFQRESIEDRSAIHQELAVVAGDVKTIDARLTAMATQLDYVYRKIYNGASK